MIIDSTTRIQPQKAKVSARSIPLSILDATTANFALTSAVWVFNAPTHLKKEGVDLKTHLTDSLPATLDAYPHWAGQIRAIQTLHGDESDETASFPAHSRRYGRIYARFGDDQDPGVELTSASSTATANELHPPNRTEVGAPWKGQSTGLYRFVSSASIANAFHPDARNDESLLKPVMAIQITELACGGFVLAAKISHPLADITALVSFVKDWAVVSRARLDGLENPVALSPVFNPLQLDTLAAGNIDTDTHDAEIMQRAINLPLHRYDWWLPAADCPWPTSVPEPFRKTNLTVGAGVKMPWSEWDTSAPVSHYVVHFSQAQVELLTNAINKNSTQRLSQHDAVLAHVWSCIARARNLARDSDSIHCDLVYGVRPAFGLPTNFIGSPVIMINIELPGSQVAAGVDTSIDLSHLGPIATGIRNTLSEVAKAESIAAYMHTAAFETSPQRLWQAFLGRRHILVTTWARCGIYSIDFGLGSAVCYADGIIPDMDGTILIKEAPPKTQRSDVASSSWTAHGVDISIRIQDEDMKRLLQDPLLYPTQSENGQI